MADVLPPKPSFFNAKLFKGLIKGALIGLAVCAAVALAINFLAVPVFVGTTIPGIAASCVDTLTGHVLFGTFIPLAQATLPHLALGYGALAGGIAAVGKTIASGLQGKKEMQRDYTMAEMNAKLSRMENGVQPTTQQIQHMELGQNNGVGKSADHFQQQHQLRQGGMSGVPVRG